MRLELAKLGRVEYIILPTAHHLSAVRDYLEFYPGARCFATQETLRFMRELKTDPNEGKWLKTESELEAEPVFNELELNRISILNQKTPPSTWEGELSHVIFDGIEPNEIVLFHPKSKTLLLADLLDNTRRDSIPFRFKSHMGVIFIRNQHEGGPPIVAGTNHVDAAIDPDRAWLQVQRIKRWGFEQIVLAHGNPMNQDTDEIDAESLWERTWIRFLDKVFQELESNDQQQK